MLIKAENLSKYFGSDCIISKANFYVGETSRIGLIGENGAGKSTLLRIINGELDYDEGELDFGKDAKIGYLKQNSGLDLENSIWEEMTSVFDDLIKTGEEIKALQSQLAEESENSENYDLISAKLGYLTSEFELKGGYNFEFKINTILNGMGFMDYDKNAKTKNLSGGEKTRLALAKLLLWEPSLLILDEPTNHLDFKTLMWLEDYLNKEFKGAVLIVSHDRYFLDRTVTEIWELEDKEISCYRGNYTKFSVLKKEKIKVQERKWEADRKKVAELEDYVARNLVRASTTKQAQSRRAQLEKMEITEKPKTQKKTPNINFSFDRQTVKDVFHCKGVNLFYGEDENKTYIAKNIEIDALKGEKVAIIGENGIGKSTFLKAILKMQPCEYDKLAWGGNARISYYDQEGKQLHSEKTVINELWDRFPKMSEQEVRGHLGNMLFTGEEVFKSVSSLSGGEKARLALAIIMLERPNILVMDEPTNHIDILTKEALEEALMKYEGTLILVSHDRYLLNKVPDKIYEISKDGATLYKGNFDYYLSEKEKFAPVVTEEKKEKEKSENEVKYYRSKKERAMLVSAKKKADSIDKKIAENEKKIKSLEEEMQNTNTAGDYQKLNEICELINSLKEENENLSEEWLMLAEEIEGLSKD